MTGERTLDRLIAHLRSLVERRSRVCSLEKAEVELEHDKRKLDARRLRLCRAAGRARALPTRPIESEAEGESR